MEHMLKDMGGRRSRKAKRNIPLIDRVKDVGEMSLKEAYEFAEQLPEYTAGELTTVAEVVGKEISGYLTGALLSVLIFCILNT